MATMSRPALLRQAWKSGPVMLPGVFNALVARMAERAGFSAVYLSGAALSAGHAMPDVGLITLPEFVDAARSIVQGCSLPLIADADTGFGEALNAERTVRLYEAAGVAGLHLEDQQLPKRCGHLTGKTLVSPTEMAAKLRAASSAKVDPDFVLIARTDARSAEGFDAAVERAKRYLDVGADAIFPEALESPAEFERFAKLVPSPLLANMTEFGRSPLLDVRTLGDMGYKLILFPVTTLRVALRAVERTLATLHASGTQQSLLPDMLTRAELYDLLGYTAYEARDRAYFGSDSPTMEG